MESGSLPDCFERESAISNAVTDGKVESHELQVLCARHARQVERLKR